MKQLSIGQAIEQEVGLVVRLLGRKAATVKLVGGDIQIVRREVSLLRAALMLLVHVPAIWLHER